MSRKFLTVTLSFFALTLFSGIAFVQTSAASPSKAAAPKFAKRSGLTRSGIVMARESGAGSNGLMTMHAQSNVALLQRATRVGPHDLSSVMELTVSLKLRNVDALKRFLHEVQNPESPAYHQFLTPAEFTAKYGPTKAQVAAVTDYLKAYGIKVTDVSPNRILIHSEATTAAYDRALRIMINDYKLDGRRFFSTESRPKLPADIADRVLNIIGLNNAVRMHPMSHIEPLPANAAAVLPHRGAPAPPPATSAYYNPFQIENAYDWPDITDPANGAGVTIAILTANSADLSDRDYRAFWGIYRLPQHAVTVIPVGDDGGLTNGTGETLLDMEWSGAMGPGAALDVYIAGDASLATFTDMYNQFVTDNNAQVMTTSWGLYETAAPDITLTNEQIFMQAAAQGISMFAAAGDHGSSDTTDQDNMADYPAASAYITSANGTELRADVEGNYISETAWRYTGGAISQLIEQPTWQYGPGVPQNGWRNDSDIAMNAGPRWPYMLFIHGGFGQVYGTSAVAPQLAGLFAIAVSQHDGESLGLSNKLLYGDVHAGYYTTDYRDVTTGNNGAYEAGLNWDHPTGWGSPLAKSLLDHLGVVGPSGTLQGTVTDAASGAPVVGAIVTFTPGGFRKTTGDDGSYSVILPAGDYTATVTAFGYSPNTAPVMVTDDNTTTQNFVLDTSPRATLSGKVKDGSGHGYGLYASIRVKTDRFGQVAVAWTDPTTGKYSLDLPEGFDYDLSVTPAVHGYESAQASVTLDTDQAQNFSLPVIAACTAPGYGFVAGFGEDFNGSFPPADWTVTNEVDASPWIWKTNDDYEEGNWTGGTGTSATMNSSVPVGHWGYGGLFGSSLVSPPIAVSSLPPAPLLSYRANYMALDGDALDLDISVDDGPWQNILHWHTNTIFHGTFYGLPGVKAGADLSAYAQGADTIRLRWRYYDLADDMGFDAYAQVDDVVIGKCSPVPGGLVFGQVSDANTGEGVVGATVQDDRGDTITTLENPTDANLPVGAYLLFVPSGERTLTASASRYAPTTATLQMNDNEVLTQNLVLDAGQLESDPAALAVHVMVNGQADESLTVKNTGGAPVNYHLLAVNLPPSSETTATSGRFAPVPNYAPGVDLKSPSACGPDCSRLESQGNYSRVGVPASAGQAVATFPAGISIYGLGLDRNAGDLWLGSPSYEKMRGDGKDHRFLFDGTNTGDAIDLSTLPDVVYMADMAFDDTTGMLWQISLDTLAQDSHIYELDPKTMLPTGNRIEIPSPQSERGLAYDPLSDTWYAGDFRSGNIYHFNAMGKLLDSGFVKLSVQGLAYNSATGHLFVLTSAGDHAVYVLDAKNDYAQVGYFDIPGYDPANAGAGLDYDCDGNLWISSYNDQTVWEVKSGESGWCAFKGIPWLTLAPGAGTLSGGASATVELAFDGTDHQKFTTSQAQLRLLGNTPYPVKTIPLTVHWDPQPVSLVLTGEANTDSVRKGGSLAYVLTVENRRQEGHGDATRTRLNYTLPEGMVYLASNGEGVACTAPSAGTAFAPVTVTCDLGGLTQEASKTVTIAVQANVAGTLTSTFNVSAREPNDSEKNTLEIATTVIGVADLGAGAEDATIPVSGTGTVHLSVANAGPDTATDVVLKITSGGNAKLLSATSSEGGCAPISGSNALGCDIGEIASGAGVDIAISAFGAYEGTATLTAQASTSADDPDQDNEVATATVTVKASGGSGGGGGSSGGGGGALGWLALTALLGLALTGVYARSWRG